MNEIENKDLEKAKRETLGEFIKYRREEKKYSLLELSQKTKIRIKQLENLEGNNFNDLPSRVYIIGFLKTLCNVLDLDLIEATKYLDEANITKKSNTLNIIKGNNKSNEYIIFRNKLLSFMHNNLLLRWCKVLTFGAALSASFVFFVISKYQKLDDKSSTPQVEASKFEVGKINSAKAIGVKAVSKQTVEKKEVELVKLMISAKDGDSWLAYKIDQGKIVKFILKHGRDLVLEGEKIRLMIGNPQALQIKRNGSPFMIEKKPQVSTAHLIFPEELKERYSPPYFVFNEEDGSVITKRQYEEKLKGI